VVPVKVLEKLPMKNVLTIIKENMTQSLKLVITAKVLVDLKKQQQSK